MKADKAKNSSKKAVNLTLSPAAVRMGRKLEKTLNRPSLSNVIEHLIKEEAKKTPQPA